MRLEQLQHFVAAVDEQSINRASNRLFISQQGLSSSIRALEKEVGQELLLRTKHGVQTTPKGDDVYTFAKSTLREWARITSGTAGSGDAPSTLTGTFSIASTQEYLNTYIRENTILMLKHYPHVKGQGTITSFNAILGKLSAGTIDVGLATVVYRESVDEIPLLNPYLFIPAFACRPYVWVSTQSPLALRQWITVDDILNENIVMAEGDNLYMYHCALRSKYPSFLQRTRFVRERDIIGTFVKGMSYIALDIKVDDLGFGKDMLLSVDGLRAIPLVLDDEDLRFVGGFLFAKGKTTASRKIAEEIISQRVMA